MKKNLTTLLFTNIVAVIATLWYLFTNLNVNFNKFWFLPLMAVGTAILSIVLSSLMRRFQSLWAFVATGWTLLFTFLSFLFQSFWKTAILVFVISIATEILVNGIKYFFGDILLDALLSIAFTWIIMHFDNCFITVIALLVMNVIALTTKLSFSIKNKA